jgi:hypothetical protein
VELAAVLEMLERSEELWGPGGPESYGNYGGSRRLFRFDFFFLGNLWWILRKPMFHWFWSDWLFDLVCLLSKNRFDERSNIHDIKNNTRISPTGIIHFTRNCDEDRTKQIMVWVKLFFFSDHYSADQRFRWYRAQDSRSNTEPIEECSAPSVSRRRFNSIDQSSSRAMPWLCHQRQVM